MTCGQASPILVKSVSSFDISVLTNVVVLGGTFASRFRKGTTAGVLIRARCRAPDMVLTNLVVVVTPIGSPNTIEKLNMLMKSTIMCRSARVSGERFSGVKLLGVRLIYLVIT